MPAMSGIRQILLATQHLLGEKLKLSAGEARIEAQALLCSALGGVSRAWLIAHDQELPSRIQAETFSNLLQRRLAGEPVAYILGAREFFGLNFRVTPEVLIPRPDTETLVEAALEKIPENESCRVLDLGTGSGAIAIAIAINRPQSRVSGVDRSPDAVRVANENARLVGAGNVDFQVSDWFSAIVNSRYDFIVSNPPYIAADDPHLSQGDLRFEPITALASGTDGLDDIRHLVREAPKFLAPRGWLMLEHGYDQAERVTQLMRAAGFSEVRSAADLAGILRVTLGQKH